MILNNEATTARQEPNQSKKKKDNKSKMLERILLFYEKILQIFI